jgi:hypothetical protein
LVSDITFELQHGNDIAIGQQASVANFSTFGVAIGRQATASSYYTTAVGTGSTASGANNASAFGYNATASGADSAAVGYSATASGSGSVAVGRSAGASGFGGISIGQNSDATGSQSAAYGYNAQATGGQSLALGLNSVANQPNTIAIGYGPDATADQAIAIGNDAQARGVNTVVIGHDAQGASGANSVVSIGLSANVQGFAGVAVGANSSAGAANTLHINASGAVTNAPATAGHMVIETDDAKLEYDGNWTLDGGKLLSGQIEKQYKYEGSLAVNTGTARLYIPVACSATDINLYLKTASSSGSVGVDFLINGTVDTSMTIAQGSTSGSGSSTTAISAGSYITFDITSAGTGAEDLYAAISLTRS